MAKRKKIPKYRVKSISRQSIAGRFNSNAFGHALGLVSALALFLYAVMTWLSDYNPTIIIQQYPLGFSFYDWTLIIGLIETYVLSYIGGWIFAKIYNRVVR